MCNTMIRAAALQTRVPRLRHGEPAFQETWRGTSPPPPRKMPGNYTTACVPPSENARKLYHSLRSRKPRGVLAPLRKCPEIIPQPAFQETWRGTSPPPLRKMPGNYTTACVPGKLERPLVPPYLFSLLTWGLSSLSISTPTDAWVLPPARRQSRETHARSSLASLALLRLPVHGKAQPLHVSWNAGCSRISRSRGGVASAPSKFPGTQAGVESPGLWEGG